MKYFDPDKHPGIPSERSARRNDAEDDFVPDIAKKGWAEGDPLLAPWGRASLFPATVEKTTKTHVYVCFRNGHFAWVRKELVRPLHTIGVGTRAYCRRQGGDDHYPGTIKQMDGVSLMIQYDDGGSEWSTIGMIAIPSGLSPSLWEYFERYIWYVLLTGSILAVITSCLTQVFL